LIFRNKVFGNSFANLDADESIANVSGNFLF